MEVSGEDEEKPEEEAQNTLPEIPLISADEESEDEGFETEDLSALETEELDEDQEQESETSSPSADIVLNVDEEIPEQPEIEPEGGSVPVSVEMPETTKTAEDKLMADIAEAMTGSPVSLETHETLEPYKIPENLLSEANQDPSKQTAENKLLASIAQAMSESPLDAAANNAKNFEDELENLNENFEASFPDHEQPLTEEIDLSAYEADEPEEKPQESAEDSENLEPEPEKPETEIEATFDEGPLPEPVDEPEPEPAEEVEDAQIVDETPAPEPEPEPELPQESEPEPTIIEDTVSEPEPQEPEAEIVPEPGPEKEPESLSLIDEDSDDSDDSLFDGMPSELLEAMSMPDETNSEDDILLTAPPEPETQNEEIQVRDEISSYSLKKNHKEIPQENELHNNDLLSGGSDRLDDDSDDDDDFDINLLGELSGAVSFHDDEPELEPESENENDFGFDENSPSHGGFMNPDPGEEAEIDKVADLRGRLGKNSKSEISEFEDDDDENNTETSQSSGASAGILAPLCLAALLGIGGFSAWQFTEFSNRLSSGLPNMGNSQASSSKLNPSYEYAVDFVFDSNLSGRMAQRGRDGWKIVGSRRTQDSITGQSGYEFIFIKEKN